LNHTTTLTYEPSGARNLQSITDPLTHQTSFTYNGQGQPQTITTPAGITQLTYDQGDLVAITDSLGARTREIFLMHRISGLKHRDIAAHLGITVSAVEKHIAKASLFLLSWTDGE